MEQWQFTFITTRGQCQDLGFACGFIERAVSAAKPLYTYNVIPPVYMCHGQMRGLQSITHINSNIMHKTFAVPAVTAYSTAKPSFWAFTPHTTIPARSTARTSPMTHTTVVAHHFTWLYLARPISAASQWTTSAPWAQATS